MRRSTTLVATIALHCVFGVPVGVAESADNPLATAKAADFRPALVVGERPTSFYIIDKYYRRFIQTFTSENQRPPHHAETKLWLEHFVAQQLIIRNADSLGFFKRSEVDHAVKRMERHMIMAQTGPLFLKVTACDPHSNPELERIFASSGRSIDGVFVRFDNKSSFEETLGKDFQSITLEEQTRRVRQYQHEADSHVVDGRLNWPYEPFIEIASVLTSAECGRWILFQDPDFDFGQYLIFIRTESSRPLGNFEAVRRVFAEKVKDVDKRVAWKRFRLEKLSRAKLFINTATEKNLLQHCLVFSKKSPELPEMEASEESASFFSYSNGREIVDVSGGEYRQWLNDAIMRKVPISAVELSASVQDYVFEHLSLDFVRAEALDLEPQFAEDRRGFENLQVLDLYEKEILAPQLNIKVADIKEYYQGHSAEMRQTTVVKGKLLTFKSGDEAAAWIRVRVSNGARSFKGIAPPASEQVLNVVWDQPISDLEGVHYQIMHSGEGMVFGPLQRGEDYLVFVKEADVATDLIPLSLVEGTIRNKLLRPLLDDLEDRLAVEIAARYRVEDNIDYRRFDLQFSELILPWTKR